MKSRTRAGFTLVELMVAMALTMFIMVILSQAFVISLETFAAMKGIGDMQENLRSAKSILSDDLMQDHFEGNLRLSDLSATRKPQAGFFAILHGSAQATATAAAPSGAPPSGYVLEGNDAVGMPSFRAVNQILYMTVKRKGNRPENFFTTSVTGAPATFFSDQTSYTMNQTELQSATQVVGQNYNSQWAEVMYYLEQTGTTEEPNNFAGTLGTPLFALKRAEFVMVADSTNVTNKYPSASLTTFQGMSCNPNSTNTLTFYSPSDAVNATKRVSGSSVAASNRIKSVATLVLPNVTSFHIQMMPNGASSFGDIPGGGTIYDTAQFGVGAYPAPATVGLKGIQITLRVFEPKTRQSRQMTIVQDL